MIECLSCLAGSGSYVQSQHWEREAEKGGYPRGYDSKFQGESKRDLEIFSTWHEASIINF